MKTMADDLAWISTTTRRPQDRELVYARVKSGVPKKVTYHALLYEFQYFAEWAALGASERKRTIAKGAVE